MGASFNSGSGSSAGYGGGKSGAPYQQPQTQFDQQFTEAGPGVQPMDQQPTPMQTPGQPGGKGFGPNYSSPGRTIFGGGGGMDRDGNPISGGPPDNFHTSGAQPMPQPASQPLQFLDANGLPTSSHGGGKVNMNINPFNPAYRDSGEAGPGVQPMQQPPAAQQPAPMPALPSVKQMTDDWIRTEQIKKSFDPSFANKLFGLQPPQQPIATRPQPTATRPQIPAAPAARAPVANRYTRTRAPRIR